MNLLDIANLKNNFSGFTLILLLILLVAIINIIKLRKTNQKYLDILKNQNENIRKLNENNNIFNFTKNENESLNCKIVELNTIINQLKEKNSEISNLNTSYREEIGKLKKEITYLKNKENSVTISSTTLSTGKKNNSDIDLQFMNSDENILCNNLYLFVSKKRCWRCNQITPVVCLGTTDAYTLFEGETKYKRYQHLQLLSYVTKVPNELSVFLKDKHKYYPSFSKHINKKYYINHCEHCNSIQGDNYIHEVPEDAIYKHLCYKNSEKADYFVFKNEAVVPLQANLPYYDEVSSSFDLMWNHMLTEKENRASLNITQNLIDGLISDSNYCGDIEIEYL